MKFTITISTRNVGGSVEDVTSEDDDDVFATSVISFLWKDQLDNEEKVTCLLNYNAVDRLYQFF